MKFGHLAYGKFKVSIKEIYGSRSDGELRINKEKYKLVEKITDKTYDGVQRKVYRAIDRNGVEKSLAFGIYRQEGGSIDRYDIYILVSETFEGKHYYGWPH